MAFRTAELSHFANFNSAISHKFLSKYDDYRAELIIEDSKQPKSRAFAPSQLRCKRLSWFRLRGVEPDEIKTPDISLSFSADIGTACHQIIQTNLESIYGDDWIDVGWYLDNVLKPNYKYTLKQSGHETQIEIDDPPVRFACDGIVRLDGVYTLVEVKTCEWASFQQLYEPKPQHIDQVKCYSTLLKLFNTLFIYQDRLYGNIKVFEKRYSLADHDEIWDMFNEVQECVKTHIAPPRLPSNDPWCSNSNMCPFKSKCSQY